MMRSKKDVDRCVRDLLNKTKSEDERKVRGYNIARLYYNVGEHANAARYLAEFLTVRPKATDAHRLLGQIQEALGNKEKAIQAYKMAYELGEGQKDLVLKICELYTEVEADTSVRLYWAEEGQRLYPHRESVVKLRESLLSRNDAKSREELEKLYMEEINASPTDVRLQTNLLKLYLEWGKEDPAKLSEAYSYGCQVEARNPFSDSLEWYQTLLNVMQAYSGSNNKDAGREDERAFHINYLSALERLVCLTLASCSTSALLSQYTLQDAASLLHKFDKSLKERLPAVGPKTVFGQLMVGQLYLHMAIFLIHNAKKEGLTHASITSGALLFHACRFRPPERSKAWRAKEHFWYKLACHRLSQAAHTLRHMAGGESQRTQFLDRVKERCSNKEAQRSIYLSLFGASDDSNKDDISCEVSFFLSDDNFVTATLQYPEADQLKEWDKVVGDMYSGSLGDLVWLCLQQAPQDINTPQPYYSFTLFDGLQFSSASLSTCSPETLCHLDLLAFLAATVYCQRVAAKENHGPPPASLPTVLSPPLCTQEQGECWGAAHTLFTNRAHHRLAKLRMTLQRGLSVVRAHGNHGIDLPLMAHLAQCFTKWASVAEGERDGSGGSSSELEALRERAEHYWQRVLSLCVRASKNTMNVAPRNPLFVAPGMELTEQERSKVEEEGKYFLALRLVQAGKQQDAIQALGELKSPEAAFQRAMLYNEQAQAVVGEGGVEAATPEVRAQQASLLTQARDTLYLTLDRLRMPGVDRFHPLNTKLSQQLEDVERRLSLLTTTATALPPGQSTPHPHHHHRPILHHQHQDEDTESLSEASHSPHDLTNGHDSATSPPQPQHSLHHLPSPSPITTRLFAGTSGASATTTPQKPVPSRVMRQEARPSPERLHAQVQALSEVQENTLRSMEEQNAALKAQNEALRDLCTSMADGFRENSNLYRSMLEQNRALSQDAYTSVAGEVRQVHTAFKETQAQLRAMATELAEIKAMRMSAATAVAAAPAEVKVAEVKGAEEVPVDIPAAVVPPALYGGYVGYYSQPSPLMPTPGLFGNPPFFPPSTVAEQQAYSSITSSVSLAQTTATLCSPSPALAPATAAMPLPMPSPAATSLPHSQAPATNWGAVASSLTGAAMIKSQASVESPAPVHAFQIAMPTPVSASTGLTPPPRASMPAFPSTFTRTPSITQPSPPKDSRVSPGKGSGRVRGESEGDSECYVEDDHDPCPDYKPLVPLPEKVEVRTGEEDEQVMFEERAKLFRFVDKEWRERGTGTMKLLHNPGQDSTRVLMRRDQTHKICANHLITSGIDLQPMHNNDRAWVWAAQDFADEELRMEKFCCRFRTPEVANSFREAFLKAKSVAKTREETVGGEAKNETATPSTPTSTTTIKTSTPIKQGGPHTPPAAAAPSLASLFKAPAGSWNCNTCLVNNKQESVQCVACQTPNPNAPSTPTATAAASTPAGASLPFASFKFSPSSVSATTTPSATHTSLSIKFTGFPSTPTPTTTSTTTTTTTTPGFGFKFGINNNASTAATPSSNPILATPLQQPTTTSTTLDTAGKFSLSGFTFTTTPSQTAVENKLVEECEEEEKKKNKAVFSGFSFGSCTIAATSATATSAAVATVPTSSAIAAVPNSGFTFATPTQATGPGGSGSSSIFGGQSAGAGWVMSFGTPTATTTNPTATSTPSIFTAKAFESRSPVVGLAKSPSKDDSDDRVEEYEPQVDFQPVVPMPDLVEVKTGEEGEEVLFCERSKLFRYDTDTKEWKERGVGDLKILKNTSSGKVRVLMRREQVFKVCANHFITAGIKLTPMAASDKAWIWFAQDFADEEMRTERFAARFKTPELGLAFKEAFEKAQKELEEAPATDQGAPKSETETTQDTKPKLPTPAAPVTSSLAGMFKPPKGSWECEVCLVRNNADVKACVACGSHAPGVQDTSEQVIDLSKGQSPAASSSSSSSLGPSTFKFGAESSKQTFAFGVPQGQQGSGSGTTALATTTGTSQPAFMFGTAATTTTTTGASFSFGITPTTSNGNTTSTAIPQPQPAFSFGSTTTTSKPFSFEWKPPASTSTPGPAVSFAPSQPVAIPSSTHEEASTPTSATTPTKAGFVFGSPDKYEFSFAGVKAKSPRSRDISVCESEDGVLEEDEGDHLYFEPVVPLPDKVDVVTGEENEAVLYSHRAKLFRLFKGEWKERGIGDFKILNNPQTGKVRLLMRREQVHKLCLNHYLSHDLIVRRKDDKTFYWAALDYSEPDTVPKTDTFALRFKTPEIAAEFFAALNDAKVMLGGTATELPLTESASPAKPVTPAATTPQAQDKATATAKVVALADSTTPSATTEVSKGKTTVPTTATATAMPSSSMPFTAAAKTLFGDSADTTAAATPTTATTTTTLSSSFFSSLPTPTTTTTGSTFTITPSAPLFGSKTPLFGNTTAATSSSLSLPTFASTTTSTPHVFGGLPSFTINVSSNFSMRTSPAPLSQQTGSSTSQMSVFGGATTTSSVPRSSFSFGDKFSSEPDSTNEVQVVYEKRATPEQIDRARKLFLPDSFYLYEDAPPCPGCPGCEPEEDEKHEVVKITATTPMFGGSGTSNLKPVQFSFMSTSTASPAFDKPATASPGLFSAGANNNATITVTPFSSVTPGLLDPKPGIFGGVPPASGSIFGGTPTTTASIFGGSQAASSGSIFGGASASSGTSIFGGTQATTTTFGATTTTPSIFPRLATTSTTTTGFFSGSASSGSTFFSSPTPTTSAAAPHPITPGFFSSSLANASSAVTPASPSLFSTPPSGLLGSGGPFAGKEATGGPIQGTQSPTSINQLSFADMAKSGTGEGFGKKQLDPKQAAVWASMGQPVFGKSPKKVDGEEGGEDDDHDPHFEPVVPLPDLVEVKTGEENLEVIYCHRAKLYRFDGNTKQWKERGVGDFKILYDSATSKYRLLQRREQVHKLCCNHYLTAQTEIRPLSLSESAWCWFATDYSEKPEGKIEQLALRFKTVDLAMEFKTKIDECQANLRRIQSTAAPSTDSSTSNSNSTSTSATVVLPLTTTTKKEEEVSDGEDEEEEEEEVEEEEEEDDDEVDTDDDDDEDEEEEDEDEEDEDSTVMFSEQCTLSKQEGTQWKELGTGQLAMHYDDEIFGARIIVTADDDTQTLAEHIVAIQTAMHREGERSATWSVLNLKPEPQGHATFKADFPNTEAAEMFAKSFAEAKEYAENSNLMEEPSLSVAEILSSDLIYGQGADDED